MLKSGINNCWATPIYKTSISQEDFDSLVNTLMLIENVHRPQAEFDHDSLTEKIPLLKKLAYEKYNEFFNVMFNTNLDKYDYAFKSWLTGSTGNYYMDLHNHTGVPFVAVFYALAEEQDKGGELMIYDPRGNANRGFNTDFKDMFAPIEFLPKTGDVIIMPGFLYHSVRPFQSSLRLAIPVDLFITD